MSHDRRQHNWWKRALGVALAQFVAIQLVLGAAVAVQMVSIAPLDAATLCADGHGGPSGDNGQSNVGHHELCAICAFTAHATPLPDAMSIAVEGRSFAHALRPDWSTVATVARRHNPRSSQGPPLNA